MKRLIAALGAVVLLGACSAEAEPKAEPPTTPPAPTPSATPQAQTPLPSTPEDAVRAWIAASDAMQISGDTHELRRLSTEQCDSCQSFAAQVESIFEAGGTAESPRTEILEIEGRIVDDRFRYVTSVMLHPTKVVQSAGAKPTPYEGGKGTFVFGLNGSGGTWRIDYFGQLP